MRDFDSRGHCSEVVSSQALAPTAASLREYKHVLMPLARFGELAFETCTEMFNGQRLVSDHEPPAAIMMCRSENHLRANIQRFSNFSPSTKSPRIRRDKHFSSLR
ncbi:hypothetical protein KCU59_g47, partial [Aureobasidium melanogenum]